MPAIVVDQFGYTTSARKVAVLRSPAIGYDNGFVYEPGGELAVVDAGSGRAVFAASPKAWRHGAVDPVSGDRTRSFDFSSVRTPGTYYVEDTQCDIRTEEFRIADDAYDQVLRAAMRTFFYQRAGVEKEKALAGDKWADGASHLGPGQDAESRSWADKDDPGSARDLRGGWYDAGDYNKYSAWHAGYLIALLHTHREHPDLSGDDLGIPESGNGVPDLVDEIRWGLQWLARMQGADGSVLCVQSLSPGSPPSKAKGPSYYGPSTTYATLKAAAAFALASSVFAASGIPELRDAAPELESRALRAWAWAEANPDVTYYNNAEGLQPGSGGLGGGQQETDAQGRDAARVESAVYLYDVTRRSRFRDLVAAEMDSYLPENGQAQWLATQQETMLYFGSLPGVPRRLHSRIQRDYRSRLTETPELLGSPEVDPYLAPIKQYTWGSNRSKATHGRLLSLAPAYRVGSETAEAARDAAEGYIHYLHGVNPLGLTYLTNMGSLGADHSANTMHHTWFADGTIWDVSEGESPGPPPGFLVGGPNPEYSVDDCCANGCSNFAADRQCRSYMSPPEGQPPMKSYLQFNADWPLNSWEVSENSNGYQVEYIRLLAAVVDDPPSE